VGSKIGNLVSELFKHLANAFLITKSSVVRANGNFHVNLGGTWHRLRVSASGKKLHQERALTEEMGTTCYPRLAIICFLAAAAGGVWLLLSIMWTDHKSKLRARRR
jgi:hypothetical protein